MQQFNRISALDMTGKPIIFEERGLEVIAGIIRFISSFSFIIRGTLHYILNHVGDNVVPHIIESRV